MAGVNQPLVRFMMAKANMTERYINLVLPLAQKATAMREIDTNDSNHARSSAVSNLIGNSLRTGDVDSKKMLMRGFRTSIMEIRTITTPITTTALERSADKYERHHVEFSFTELVQAYFDCRKNKRNTASALAFEQNLETNLSDLYADLISGNYQIGKSICFVITRPKPREVWAAEFRDRVVHHLLYNRISPRFYASFISDSCACMPNRGTLYGAKRLEAKIRSITQNWSAPAYYLKLDLANFFVSINKNILKTLIAERVHEPYWMALVEQILFDDPRHHFEFHGAKESIELVPAHKRLANQTTALGLPIGNLSSQFFANIYLDVLDQFVKHQIGAKHYIRYVDDFIILHESAQWLNDAKARIEVFLMEKLGEKINPKKTILQPIDRGVDFVGQVIKPWQRSVRRRNVKEAIKRIKETNKTELLEVANSYFGLLRQASHSHHDRAKLSKTLLRLGNTVDGKFTKTFSKRELA